MICTSYPARQLLATGVHTGSSLAVVLRYYATTTIPIRKSIGQMASSRLLTTGRCLLAVFFFAMTLQSTTTIWSTINYHSLILQDQQTAAANRATSTARLIPNQSTTVVVSIDETTTHLPPCKILVTNSPRWHAEVIESVGKLFPLKYLNISRASDCNQSHLVFDHMASRSHRSVAWLPYYNSYLKDSTLLDVTSDGATVVREMGNATLVRATRFQESLGKVSDDYDAVIETSCYCTYRDFQYLARWMQNGDHHSCVFHERCDNLKNHSRAVWVSPHYPQHFIPWALPDVNATLNASGKKTKLDICSIGTTGRRRFHYLEAFFDDPRGQQYFNRTRIRILGEGNIPNPIKKLAAVNSDFVLHQSIADHVKFHQAIVECDVIVLLMHKDRGQPDYFMGKNSKWKMSGSIPPIIAYHKPFVMPDELFEMYKDYLPLDVPHASFSESGDVAIIPALSSVLERLMGNLTEV